MERLNQHFAGECFKGEMIWKIEIDKFHQKQMKGRNIGRKFVKEDSLS